MRKISTSDLMALIHLDDLLGIVQAFAAREPLDGLMGGLYPPGCRYCHEIVFGLHVRHRDDCPWIRARKLLEQLDA